MHVVVQNLVGAGTSPRTDSVFQMISISLGHRTTWQRSVINSTPVIRWDQEKHRGLDQSSLEMLVGNIFPFSLQAYALWERKPHSICLHKGTQNCPLFKLSLRVLNTCDVVVVVSRSYKMQSLPQRSMPLISTEQSFHDESPGTHCPIVSTQTGSLTLERCALYFVPAIAIHSSTCENKSTCQQ